MVLFGTLKELNHCGEQRREMKGHVHGRDGEGRPGRESIKEGKGGTNKRSTAQLAQM